MCLSSGCTAWGPGWAKAPKEYFFSVCRWNWRSFIGPMWVGKNGCRSSSAGIECYQENKQEGYRACNRLQIFCKLVCFTVLAVLCFLVFFSHLRFSLSLFGSLNSPLPPQAAASPKHLTCCGYGSAQFTIVCQYSIKGLSPAASCLSLALQSFLSATC